MKCLVLPRGSHASLDMASLPFDCVICCGKGGLQTVSYLPYGMYMHVASLSCLPVSESSFVLAMLWYPAWNLAWNVRVTERRRDTNAERDKAVAHNCGTC